MVEANAKEKDPVCPECKKRTLIRYDEPALQLEPGKETVAQSFDLRLNDGKYKCYECGEFTLEFFKEPLLWD